MQTHLLRARREAGVSQTETRRLLVAAGTGNHHPVCRLGVCRLLVHRPPEAACTLF